MSLLDYDQSRASRGQLVLLAAGVIVIALFPVVLAYFQLGYAGDVQSDTSASAPTEETLRALERATFDAGAPIQSDYEADESGAARQAFLDRFDNSTAAVETSQLAAGTVVEIEVNNSVASAYATSDCPGGDGRAFGNCTATDGVVTQERAGQAHVVAVGVDVRLTTEDGSVEVTDVVDVLTGDRLRETT